MTNDTIALMANMAPTLSVVIAAAFGIAQGAPGTFRGAGN